MISYMGDINNITNTRPLAYRKRFVLCKEVTSGERMWFATVYEIVNRYIVSENSWNRVVFGILSEEEFLLQQLSNPIKELYED